jgi:uncharacterized protein YbjT (DUF2867 family)
MKRLVILGASGMVGRAALRYALQIPGVEHVTSIARRKIGVAHTQVTEVIHSDFTDCAPLAGILANQDAAIFCLGTYTGTVSDSELRRITVDYTVEFARVLRGASPNAGFTFLSGNGADPRGRSRIAFARYKGAAETALLAAGFPRLYIFRPAYIYPVERRQEPTFGYRVLRWVYPAFRLIFPNLVIRSDDLARVMVDVTVSETLDGPSLTFENRDILVMAGCSVQPNPA